MFVRDSPGTKKIETPSAQLGVLFRVTRRVLQNEQKKRPHCHSARSASVGFTNAARRAGRKLAAIDASPDNTATQPRVTASQACTPNNRLRIDSAAPTEQTSP